MKKITSFLLALGLMLVAMISVVNVNAAEVGTKSDDSPYFSLWQGGSFGVDRLNETKVEITHPAGWGQRGGFVDSYDLTTLDITVDMSNVKQMAGVPVALLFLNPNFADQGYIGAGMLTMDILPQAADQGNYLVTYSLSGSHNVSAEGFSHGTSFHPDYSGALVETTDDLVNIKFSYQDGNVIVNLNGIELTVPSGFSVFTDPTNVQVLTTAFNGTGNVTYTVEITDAARRAYYGESGEYGVAKALLTQYTEALTADLTVEANVLAAKAIRDQINLSNIKEYDLVNLQPIKTANDEVLQAALDALGTEDKTPICEDNNKTYRLDKAGDLQISIDTLGLEVSAITVAGSPLPVELYSYAEGVLTIKEACFTGIPAGDYVAVVSTSGGSVNVNVKVYTGEEFKPSTTTTNVEYSQFSSSNVSFDLDTKGNEISSVKLNDQEIEYFYADSILTIEGTSLDGVAPGTYAISVETVEGSVSVELVITGKVNPADRVAELGVYGSDTNWWSRWQGGSHGAVRTGDTSYQIITTTGWGQRGGFLTTLDITNLHASLDFSAVGDDTTFMILFSTADNTYAGEGQTKLIIELLKISDTSFFVVLGNKPTAGEHCVSVDGFSDGSTSDKPGYSGITIEAEAGVVNFSIVKTAEGLCSATFNGENYVVDGIYNSVTDTNMYISIGAFKGSGAAVVYSYDINYFYDAATKEYYETGVYATTKALINQFVEATADLSTSELINAAIEIRESINLEALAEIDANFIKGEYLVASAKLDKTIAENPEILTSVVENAITKANEAINSIVEVANIKNAESLVSSAKEKLAELKDKYDLAEEVILALDEKVNALDTNLTGKVVEVITAEYQSFIDSVNSVTSDTIVSVLESRTKLTDYYSSYFEESAWEALHTAYLTASIALDEKVSFTNEDWAVNGSGIKVFEEEDEYTVLHDGGNLVYTKEKLPGNNFSITFNVSKFSTNTGAWLSIGLMEKPDQFIIAESQEVTQNKGILFLITKVDNETLSVQMYIITLMSAGFLTSVITETISIPTNQDVTLSLGVKEVTVAGVTGEYMDIKFNETSFSSLIPATEYTISLGKDPKGHLVIATNGTSADNAIAYEIKDINGSKPNASSLVPQEKLTPPTTSETSKSYQLGTTGKVAYTISNYGKGLISVKVGNKVLNENEYSYENNTLILKNSTLETLTAGTYDVELTTTDGSVTVKLVVNAAASTPEIPGDDTPSGGCACNSGSIIIALSTMLTVSALAFVVLKKRN